MHPASVLILRAVGKTDGYNHFLYQLIEYDGVRIIKAYKPSWSCPRVADLAGRDFTMAKNYGNNPAYRKALKAVSGASNCPIPEF